MAPVLLTSRWMVLHSCGGRNSMLRARGNRGLPAALATAAFAEAAALDGTGFGEPAGLGPGDLGGGGGGRGGGRGGWRGGGGMGPAIKFPAATPPRCTRARPQPPATWPLWGLRTFFSLLLDVPAHFYH